MATPAGLPIVVVAFLATEEEVSIVTRDHMAHSAKNIYYLSYYRENLLTFAENFTFMSR